MCAERKYVLTLMEAGSQPELVAEAIKRAAHNAEEETLTTPEGLVAICQEFPGGTMVSASLSKEGAEMIRQEIEAAGGKCVVQLLGSTIEIDDPDLSPETNAVLQAAYKAVEDKEYDVETVRFKWATPERCLVWITGFSGLGEKGHFKIALARNADTGRLWCRT